MSISTARAEAVAATMAEIRAIEGAHGVTPACLERLKPVLIALATRSELFPPAQFPVPPGRPGSIYRLTEDGDRRFALYASAGVAGKKQPPHNHTTWAVIAGVFGDEHNVVYRRIDDRGTPGRGAIEKTGELTVCRGNAVAFLPDDFHTIEVLGSGHSLHLHCYGMSLENLPGRVFFPDGASGATKHFPANPNIRTVPVDPSQLRSMMADGAKLMILDARTPAAHAKGHLPGALPLPADAIGADRRFDAVARIVLYDDREDGPAEIAALALMHRGCRNLAVLAGGIEAWTQAGLGLAA
jgi:predicted metal-dependent enzyme (double-stranded beta helix superfamily)